MREALPWTVALGRLVLAGAASVQSDRDALRLPCFSVDSSTCLVLTNAVYFEGSWAQPFATPSTSDEDFAAPWNNVPIKMMRQPSHFAYAKLDGHR